MALDASALENDTQVADMARKSFPIAIAAVRGALIPFFSGIEGLENLPADNRYIIAANHSSFIDGPLLGSAIAYARALPLHMIAYGEPFRHWLFGWIMKSTRAIPFDRGDVNSRKLMMQNALGYLAMGEPVAIFPEAHLSSTMKLGRARPGVALLALESASPVVPAGIVGVNEVFPPNSRFPRPNRKIRLVLGTPIPMTAQSREYHHADSDTRRTIVNTELNNIMSAIAGLSGRTWKSS